MTQRKMKWKKLYEDENEIYWQTPPKKNGECSFVVRSRGIDTYYTKEEFLEYQNIINKCMEIENSAVILPPENFYRSCRRMGDNQW